MKDKNALREPGQSASMVEDKATEKLKKRLQDLGLIVNAGARKPDKPAGKKEGAKK